jgi:hypothetical protein
LEKFIEKKVSLDSERAQLAVTHMLDLQQSIHKIQKAIYAQNAVDDMKASAFIPIILESYSLYTLETHLIKKLVQSNQFFQLRLKISDVDDMEVLGFLIEKFYAQYIDLRQFYFDTSNIKSVTSIIAVPTLPKVPQHHSL